jgi:hypothetical protein
MLTLSLSNTVLLSQTQTAVAARVKKALIEQVLKDDSQLRDCLGKDGLSTKEQFVADLEIEPLDLNKDGQPEFLVQPSNPCSCGAQNCSIWVYQQAANGYRMILDASGLGLTPEKTVTNGYMDLSVDSHNNAATRFQIHHKFDGRQYRESRTDFIDMETGAVKPAQVRVKFRRGNNSATMKGNVSLGFPDTYILGASAGQTMTVQLSAPKKSAAFMIMGPGYTSIVDNVTQWTGALPDSGDYTITVDAMKGKTTYTLTMAIR